MIMPPALQALHGGLRRTKKTLVEFSYIGSKLQLLPPDYLFIENALNSLIGRT